MRDRVASATSLSFNACLCNHYRDGRDSIGAHADDEPELGPMPQVASLSLGSPRLFVLRPNTLSAGQKGGKHSLMLMNGSLLVMRGETQLRFKHEVPKSRADVGPRINLTFRQVFD